MWHIPPKYDLIELADSSGGRVSMIPMVNKMNLHQHTPTYVPGTQLTFTDISWSTITTILTK